MTPPKLYVPIGVAMPPQRRKKIPLFRPKVGQEYLLLITNARPVGLMRHWNGTRSRIHVEPATECVFCVEKQKPIWTSYLGVWSVRTSCYGLAEVTRDAAEAYAPFHPSSTDDLRGKSLRLWREGIAYNSPIRGKVADVKEKQYLPEPLNMARALETLFELPDGWMEYIGPDEGVVPTEPQDADPEVQGL